MKRLNRRTFLRGMTAGGALLAGAPLFDAELAFAQECTVTASGDAAKRPNFVFILCDDLRKGALGSEGHPFIKTPNIDRLGREGMTFENAFVATPVCSPSRASFLTGQFPHTHGVIKNTRYEELSHRLVTFPRLLHEAGYETAHVGKWHMGQDDTPRPGYDRWVCLKGQGEYDDPTLNVDGRRVQTEGYSTDVLTDYAVEFLKVGRSKPFLLYLAVKAPHGPSTPAARHKTLFADEKITRAPSAVAPGGATVPGDLEGKPAVAAGQRKDKRSTAQSDETIRNYLRTVVAVDEGVGRILQTLEETGQLDNTVVIFTSDHGVFWGEHNLQEKRLAYDEALRIPLLVRYPKGIKAGVKSASLVQAVDVAPTLLELGSAPVPANIQGRSFVPLLKGQTPPDWRTAILAEFEPTNQEPFPAWQAVRTERGKYIHYRSEEKGLDELYDLTADPYEMKNRINEPDAQALRETLKKELRTLLEESSKQPPAVTGTAPSKPGK